MRHNTYEVRNINDPIDGHMKEFSSKTEALSFVEEYYPKGTIYYCEYEVDPVCGNNLINEIEIKGTEPNYSEYVEPINSCSSDCYRPPVLDDDFEDDEMTDQELGEALFSALNEASTNHFKRTSSLTEANIDLNKVKGKGKAEFVFKKGDGTDIPLDSKASSLKDARKKLKELSATYPKQPITLIGQVNGQNFTLATAVNGSETKFSKIQFKSFANSAKHAQHALSPAEDTSNNTSAQSEPEQKDEVKPDAETTNTENHETTQEQTQEQPQEENKVINEWEEKVKTKVKELANHDDLIQAIYQKAMANLHKAAYEKDSTLTDSKELCKKFNTGSKQKVDSLNNSTNISPMALNTLVSSMAKLIVGAANPDTQNGQQAAVQESLKPNLPVFACVHTGAILDESLKNNIRSCLLENIDNLVLEDFEDEDDFENDYGSYERAVKNMEQFMEPMTDELAGKFFDNFDINSLSEVIDTYMKDKSAFERFAGTNATTKGLAEFIIENKLNV